MASNPVNLAVRFLLEVAALVALGWWGATLGDGIVGVLLAIAFPAAAAGLWGVFNVPGDPSRSGAAPIVVPGWVRLLLEVGVLTLGGIAWIAVGATMIGIIYWTVLVIHYAASYERVAWLLRGGAG